MRSDAPFPFCRPGRSWILRRSIRRSVLIVLAGWLAIAVHSVANAACEDEPAVCAKQAFEAGIAAYRDEQYQAALEQFRAAQRLRPHPVVLFNVAQAEARVGLVVESLRHFQQVYDDPNTPENLLGKVRAEREAATKQVATVSLEDSGATLEVDGVQAQGDPPSIELNPGRHEITISVDGDPIERRTLTLSSGETARLAVPRRPDTAAPGPSSESPPEGAHPPVTGPPVGTEPAADEDHAGISRWWVVGGGGLTLALAGATVWSGLDTRRAYRNYEQDVDELTPSERQDRVDEGKDRQLRTNVLIGVTSVVGVATAATAGLWVDWSPRQRRSSLTVGPGTLAYRCRF